MSRITIAYLDEQKFSREEEGEALDGEKICRTTNTLGIWSGRYLRESSRHV